MTGRWHPPQSSGPSLGGGVLTAAPAPAAGLVRLAEGGAGAACSSRRFPLVDDDGGGNGDGGAGVGAFDGPAAEDRWLPDGVPFVVGAGAGTVGAGAGAGAVAGTGVEAGPAAGSTQRRLRPKSAASTVEGPKAAGLAGTAGAAAGAAVGAGADDGLAEGPGWVCLSRYFLLPLLSNALTPFQSGRDDSSKSRRLLRS